MVKALILYLAILPILPWLVSALINIAGVWHGRKWARYPFPTRMLTPSPDSTYIRRLMGQRQRQVTRIEVLSSVQLVVEKILGWWFSVYLFETLYPIIIKLPGLGIYLILGFHL
ncbi:hypothetical protein QL093DRAFT_2356186 [Fusarium oxysporum]|nr:hypothetical protein QL093DRAFT_2356186 [Fusarium oxysporum]